MSAAATAREGMVMVVSLTDVAIHLGPLNFPSELARSLDGSTHASSMKQLQPLPPMNVGKEYSSPTRKADFLLRFSSSGVCFDSRQDYELLLRVIGDEALNNREEGTEKNRIICTTERTPYQTPHNECIYIMLAIYGNLAVGR